MFKKLRNKIVIINMATTTAVLIIAFGAIYFAAADNASHRPVPQDQEQEAEQEKEKEQENVRVSYSDDVITIIRERVRADRNTGLRNLLVTLVVTGMCVEVAVLLFSLYLADQSIKPVKDTYEAQKEFIANASHEIKTPLAVIQANLEAADIQGNQWIDNVAAKVEDLAALNQQLLTLARLEATTTEQQAEEVELRKFVRGLISPLRPQLDAKKITLTVDDKGLKKQKVTLKRDVAKQILNILLDNAIKYGKSEIMVRITDKYIAVMNDGTTISPEKQKHIFERFYQADKTKNGVGLGLAIAKRLADGNGWKLTAGSDEKTTTFKLEL